MSNEYPQPVEPMSRAEAILRGDETVVPMSRIEDLLKQLIAGGGGGGSTVTITTDYKTGTKIATLTIDGTDYNVYIPTDQIGSIVSITTDYQSGTKIATLTIDDTDYNIYIPADQVGAKTYKDTSDPSSDIGVDGDLYFKLHRNDTQTEHDFTPVWTQGSWNEVDNPYYEDFYGYKGTFTQSSSSTTVTKTAEQIPVYNSTVQNDPASYKFWAYNSYKWCAIARSADNKKLYFYDAAGNASYTAQKVITSGIDGYTDQFVKRGDSWLALAPNKYSETEQVIGVWTDGKPLYRLTKTITLSSAISAGHNQVLQLDTAYEIHSVSCIGLESGIYYPLPYATTNGCITPQIDDSGYFDLFISGTSGFSAGCKFEITIEYTKSTD